MKHRTDSKGRASGWKSTLTLEEILQRHLQGKTALATASIPLDGIPDAQNFIQALKAFTPDVELTADGSVAYGRYNAYYWYAFNRYLYAYIPEVDSAERYEDEWANPATVEEFVQEVQHSVWFTEFQQEVENYIENHPEFPFK